VRKITREEVYNREERESAHPTKKERERGETGERESN